MSDYIKREDALDAFNNTFWVGTYKAILNLPSADVVEREAIVGDYNTHEWCIDCKEYDQERHRCPRWNDIIRRTVEDNKVVNCIECKWSDRDKRGQLFCKVHIHHYNVSDFDYCSWGEREDSDETI